jgi:hypothetical protein
VEVDAQPDRGVRAGEAPQTPRQQRMGGVGPERHRQLALAEALGERDLVLEVVELRDDPGRLLEEHQPEIGGLHALAVAREQRQPELALERLDRAAERRLCDAQRLGRADEASVLGEQPGLLDLPEVERHPGSTARTHAGDMSHVIAQRSPGSDNRV